MEHAWLMGEEGEEDDGGNIFAVDRDLEPEESSVPVAVLASDPSVPRKVSRAAKEWRDTITYGLWQVSDPEPAPGLWLTDIVTGVRR
jgi:hypothetical protein